VDQVQAVAPTQDLQAGPRPPDKVLREELGPVPIRRQAVAAAAVSPQSAQTQQAGPLERAALGQLPRLRAQHRAARMSQARIHSVAAAAVAVPVLVVLRRKEAGPVQLSQEVQEALTLAAVAAVPTQQREPPQAVRES